MQEGDNDDNRQIYIPFSTMSDIKDTKYLDGIWMNYSGDHELVERICGPRWPLRITSGPRTTTRSMSKT
jgi:hypothetical protein